MHKCNSQKCRLLVLNLQLKTKVAPDDVPYLHNKEGAPSFKQSLHLWDRCSLPESVDLFFMHPRISGIAILCRTAVLFAFWHYLSL